ncbi:uncharacterized protein LOC110091889 isoform X2 [Dendrobium catenatum]|uniref:CCHC-type domain-containing protein n=1 Tax=Dendrobium catenatum TaxID=906689 RepID=A0A2I0W3B2_9ASPA|nr:uncharacterized protein LOC110091889 isoform X2 [Dendrobium catenatum]XP_020671837.1 uncharacterized protein LOC110091889 isoform X2 [Dendrobium catenatum]PKU70128.1 hypothetical protein MA16_Dca020618 [Dendrobium catenatum]
MNRRGKNMYCRRGAPEERYTDDEEDITSRNLGREEVPPEVIINTNTFTQMMTIMTQLLQESRSQFDVGADKYLKLFQDMRPPLFKGNEGPIEAENWLLRIDDIFDSMSCPNERKVSLVSFALDEEAKRWWRGQREDELGDIPNTLVNWEDFVKLFRQWFVPMSARIQMQDKFISLIQGDKSVMQYEAEFTTLSRYAPQLIATAEEKYCRFLSGLKDAIRQPLVPFGIEDYSVLVERARRVEIDFQITQKRKDQYKRKNVDEDIQSNQNEESNGKKPKFNPSGVSSATVSKVMEACAKCGKLHKGECLMGSNTCYWCRQPGHFAKYCPRLG